ncbi:hypothetical protein [Dactylosporangium cerinum]
MTTLKPGSMLLGTTRPAELRAWYIKALAPEFTGEGAIDLGGFLLVIDGRDDVEAKNNEPGRTIINFHVDDFDAVEAQLNAPAWSGSRSRTGRRAGSARSPTPTGTTSRSSSGRRTPEPDVLQPATGPWPSSVA